MTNAIDSFFGSEPSDDKPPLGKSGFIAVVGRPNAGKSTLVNHIVGQHIAIVSPIAQTTRRIVRAAARRGESQLIFVDLPGSQKPMDRMTERMQQTVEVSLADVDIVLWVIDVMDKIGAGEQHISDLVLRSEKPVVIALNKVDRARDKGMIVKRIVDLQELLQGREFAALVPISAQSGDGVEDLLDELVELLPQGPAWFGEDDLVDMRDDERIAEYVREATLSYLRDELPHASAVTVDEIVEDAPDHQDRTLICCTIWVERQSQVGIVVGKSGSQIRDIGISARKMIERELSMDVHLQLRVKVRKHWRDDKTWLARAGL